MKKLALTNLILLIAIKSVSACSYAVDPNNPIKETTPKDDYDFIIFLSSFALVLPVVILFFLRKRQGLWAVVVSVISLLLFIPVIFVTAIFNPCDASPVSFVIKAELILMLSLFTVQLFSWIKQRRKLNIEIP